MRSFGSDDFEVYSTGTEPKELHPMAIEIMKESIIDISHQKSKHIDIFLDQTFDFIIMVCHHARENCPIFPGNNECIHWGIDDPIVVGNDQQQRQLSLKVYNEISERVRLWILDFGFWILDFGFWIIVQCKNLADAELIAN